MQPRPEPDWTTVEIFIERHPGGAGFQEIAEAWCNGGVSHQLVQQIYRRALLKLHRHLLQRGLTIDMLEVGHHGRSVAAEVADLGER
jgi:hypothetical protein